MTAASLAETLAARRCGVGIFESLHGHPLPAGFANAVNDAAASCYGSVGREWLHRIVPDRDGLVDIVADGVRDFVLECVPDGASGQPQRVARRFGLVAVAGELATHYGLTGWRAGEAQESVRVCFNAWLEGFGAGHREDRAIVEQVRTFIERYGVARFQGVEADGGHIPNRAGFWRDENNARQYMILSGVFKDEVVSGFTVKHAAEVLKSHGMLIPGEDGRPQRKVRLPGMGSTRVYCIVLAEEVQP
jgi:putative DNA primase/helicase